MTTSTASAPESHAAIGTRGRSPCARALEVKGRTLRDAIVGVHGASGGRVRPGPFDLRALAPFVV